MDVAYFMNFIYILLHSLFNGFRVVRRSQSRKERTEIEKMTFLSYVIMGAPSE